MEGTGPQGQGLQEPARLDTVLLRAQQGRIHPQGQIHSSLGHVALPNKCLSPLCKDSRRKDLSKGENS